MPRLPVELLDNIFDDAITLAILPVKTVVLVCHHAKLRYQKLMFKSVKLDPFDKDIPDLGDLNHDHLIPHIEQLRIVNRSNSSTLPSTKGDLPWLFTSFLRHAAYATSMIVRDPLIPWQHLSAETIDAFCTVFGLTSFHSLYVSVNTPLPSWMLLRGTHVASQLTVHSVGLIVPPPETTRLASYQCLLTHLVLSDNAAVNQVAEFCLHQQNLALDLLRNVVTLGLVYDQTYASLVPPVIRYAEILLDFLAPQLQVLDLCVEFFNMPPCCISQRVLRNLKVLQCLTIHISGCTIGSVDTLRSAELYVRSVFMALLPSCPLKSLCFKVSDWRVIDPGYQSQYNDLLGCIYNQLFCPRSWPRLNSAHILVDVDDGGLSEPFERPTTIYESVRKLKIISLLRVNSFKSP